MKAIWNDQVLAESSETVIVESNHYFPESSLNKKYFQDSQHRTICPWKGEANYFDVLVGDSTNENAAWYYPEIKEKASHIEGMIAFWRGVQIVE